MSENPSVILLHGNDEFAISEHIERLCAGLGDPSTAGMNIAHFDGRLGLDFEALNTAVNAVPFLAPRRVMVLANPSSVFNSADGRKKLINLLDKAQPTTTIVLAEYEELKRDHWLLKWALKAMPRAVKRDLEKHSGCISGAATVRQLNAMLRSAGFRDAQVIVKEESAAFIKDWFPGSGVERYVRSADVRATKP